jgi:hypothetical protein
MATSATAGRCVATNVTGQYVATRAVAATDAGESADGDQQDQDEGDDPKHPHSHENSRDGCFH